MSNMSNLTKLLGILNNMALDGCYDDIMNRQIKNRELLKEVIKDLQDNLLVAYAEDLEENCKAKEK
tara:strand:+ start:542 stop:739 length:198 start_codon:yes stop_codon:yes gene_type:complete